MKKVLITGASGLIGFNVFREALRDESLTVLGCYNGFAFDSRPSLVPLDLTNETDVWNLVMTFRPNVIIHAAAHPDPKFCEDNKPAAEALNLSATKLLCTLAEQVAAKLVFLSTDLVFDGSGKMYDEAAKPRPISFYGQLKADAEKFIATNLENHVILRTTIQLGESPKKTRSVNEQFLNAIAKGERPAFFTDEFRTPIGTANLAQVILEMSENDATGIFHATGDERLSRYELGAKVATHFGVPLEKIVGKKISDVVSIPPRTPDCSLNNIKLKAILNTPILPIDEVIVTLKSI
jgi:dTDP-4-dehydrorhamnose reductase